MNLTGIKIAAADRHMPLKKRNRALQIGDTIFLHRKVYKRLCRRGANIERILSKVQLQYRLPNLTLDYALQLKESYRFRDEQKMNWMNFMGVPFPK